MLPENLKLLVLLATVLLPSALSATWGEAEDSVTLTFKTSPKSKADRFDIVPEKDKCTALDDLTDEQVYRFGDRGSSFEIQDSTDGIENVKHTLYEGEKCGDMPGSSGIFKQIRYPGFKEWKEDWVYTAFRCSED